MNPSTGWRDTISFVLFCALTVLALLAPVAPFVMLLLAARRRPDLWAAYWQHPWGNGLLLGLLLAAARTAFLWLFYWLSRVSSAAIYPAAFAWYPESTARTFLANRGGKVAPRPDESRFRCFGIAFALNAVFWGVLLTIAAAAAVGVKGVTRLDG